MTAKFRVKNLKQVQANLRKNMRKELRSKSMREGVGRVVVGEMRKNYIRPAADFTLKMRKLLEKFNSTHKTYKRTKINATFTGELLNDLQSNVKAKFNSKESSYVFEHSDRKHSNYKTGGKFKPRKVQVTSLKTKKTRNVTQKVSYKRISKYLIEKGVNYFDLPKKGEEKLIKYVQKNLLKRLKRIYS